MRKRKGESELEKFLIFQLTNKVGKYKSKQSSEYNPCKNH